MKKLIKLAITAALMLGIFAFCEIRRCNDVFTQLGMETPEARESIFSNFENGSLEFPYSKVVTKLALGKREGVVREIGDYIKAYTASPEFAKQYSEAREAARPASGPGPEERLKARIEEITADMASNETDRKKASPELRKLYELTYTELAKELKALKNPSDPAHAYYRKKAVQLKDWEEASAESELQAWKEAYPPTVKELVRKRLSEFLQKTADIDFNARLVKRGDKMIFADPALEAKDSEWKRLFRCGPETIKAARAYAQQWLKAM